MPRSLAQMHQTARWAAHLTQGPGSLAAGASHVIGLRASLGEGSQSYGAGTPTVLPARVTAPMWARALPFSVAPVLRVID